MIWILLVVLYFLCGLGCAVIAAKIEAADPGDSSDADGTLVAIFFAWPIFLVVLMVMGSIMGVEKLITWLARTIPDIKFTSKEE